jgi:phage-related holin
MSKLNKNVNMKTPHIISAISMLITFIVSYFTELTLQYAEQYLVMATIIFADGFFGIIAGIKREGFKTYKALKILKTLVFWVVFLTLVLSIENSFNAVFWLSETIITPFIVFQLISILKNASMSGIIKTSLLNEILDKIDQHKGIRIEENVNSEENKLD